MLRLSSASSVPESYSMWFQKLSAERYAATRLAAQEVFGSFYFSRLDYRDSLQGSQHASEYILVWWGYYQSASEETQGSEQGRSNIQRNAWRQLQRLLKQSWGYRGDSGEKLTRPPAYVDCCASQGLREVCDLADGYPSRALWSSRSYSQHASADQVAIEPQTASILDIVDPDSVRRSPSHRVEYGIDSDRQFSFVSCGSRD